MDQDAFGITDCEPRYSQSRAARLKLEGRVVERHAPARSSAVRQTFRDLVGESLEVERPRAQPEIKKACRESQHGDEAGLDIESPPQHAAEHDASATASHGAQQGARGVLHPRWSGCILRLRPRRPKAGEGL